MARPLHIECPGAFYHVMARGNQGRKIFADGAYRHRFLDTLAGWLRRRTTASLRWVGERLRMGRYSRVSQAVNLGKSKAGEETAPTDALVGGTG